MTTCVFASGNAAARALDAADGVIDGRYFGAPIVRCAFLLCIFHGIHPSSLEWNHECVCSLPQVTFEEETASEAQFDVHMPRAV